MTGRSLLSVIIVVLILGSTLVIDIEMDIVPRVEATIREVGPGKTYSTIQEGVDAAQPGDTVYVYAGIYNEDVTINKTINLTGEYRETTIINGSTDVIFIKNTDYINISGFTIEGGAASGVRLYYSNNSLVRNNLVRNNNYGIIVDFSDNSIVRDNIASNNSDYHGIYVYQSKNVLIEDNLCINNTQGAGIWLQESSNIMIKNNYCQDNKHGIYLTVFNNNHQIINNILKTNTQFSIRIVNSDFNIFHNNTLVGNYIALSESASIGNLVVNSTIINSTAYDITVGTTSHITLLNTTYNKSKTYFFDIESTIEIKWYLHVNVLNPNLTPAIGARVRVEDNDNGSFRENHITWYDGWKRWIVVTEYIQNSAGKTYFTPYNVSAWNRTLTAYAQPEPKMEKSEFVVLQLGKPVFYKKLNKGWNLVSIPLLQNNTSTSSVLSSIAGKYNIVQYYNSTDKRWYFYPSGDLTKINSTLGIWIHMKEDAVLSLNGSNPMRVPIILNASGNGWNLIGYPTLYDNFVSKALSTISDKYDAVQAFEALDFMDRWKHHCSKKPSELNDLELMMPGYGYWLHVTEDCVVEIGPKKILGSMMASEDPMVVGRYIINIVALNALLPMIDTELLIYDSSLNQYASQSPLRNGVTLQIGTQGLDINCTYYDINDNWVVDAADFFIVEKGGTGDTVAIINRLTGEIISQITFP